MRYLLVALAFVVCSGCASKVPSSLSPTGAVTYRANEALVAIGTVQHSAIQLNGVQVCDPLPCHPLLSDANTRLVVDVVTDAVNAVKAAPAGWKAVVIAGLDRVTLRLDAAGKTKLKSYLEAAREIVNGL